MGPPLAAEQLHRRASTASKSPADSTDAGSLQRRAASGERRAVSRTRPAVFWPSNYLAGGRLRQTLRTPLPSARAPPVAACRAAVLGAAKPVIEERLTEVRGSTVRAKPKCRFEPECAGSDKAVVSTQGKVVQALRPTIDATACIGGAQVAGRPKIKSKYRSWRLRWQCVVCLPSPRRPRRRLQAPYPRRRLRPRVIAMNGSEMLPGRSRSATRPRLHELERRHRWMLPRRHSA